MKYPRLNTLCPDEIRCARLLRRNSLGKLVFFKEFNPDEIGTAPVE